MSANAIDCKIFAIVTLAASVPGAFPAAQSHPCHILSGLAFIGGFKIIFDSYPKIRIQGIEVNMQGR